MRQHLATWQLPPGNAYAPSPWQQLIRNALWQEQLAAALAARQDVSPGQAYACILDSLR